MVFNDKIAEKLVKKWKPLLKGIENEYIQRVTSQLYENQAKAIKGIAEDSDGEQIDEAQDYAAGTTVGKLGTFQKWSFPLIRRIYPRLIANEIVGVQPLQGPVGQVFYLGHSRHKGGGAVSQVVYSKYNLTYGGLTTSAIFSGANITNAANGVNLSSLLGTNSGAPSTTIGGKIAAWTTSSLALGRDNIFGFSVSAGESLEGGEIPELNIHIEQQPVVTRTRKMRALWTLEAQQDLKAYHGLSLETELTALLSNEIKLEIDRELIEDLRMIAYDVSGSFGGFNRSLLDMSNSNNFPTDGVTPTAASFSPGSWLYQFNNAPTNPAGTARNVFLVDLTSTALGLAPRHIGEVYANLLATINIASQDIYKTTLRGPGTWLLCSPLVAALLESSAKLEGGIKDSDGPTNMGTNIEFKGKFAGKYDLYVDPLYPEDEILVGYKGANAMDAGYVYAPYIALQTFPTVVDPQTFQPRKGIMTRYGKVAITPESRYYRIIRLVGPTANYLMAPYSLNNARTGAGLLPG